MTNTTNARRSQHLRVQDITWQSRPLTTLQTAASLAGLSVASLYNLNKENRLVFKRLAGRTLVETASLIALIDSAEEYTPSTLTAVATRARVEQSRASRRQ